MGKAEGSRGEPLRKPDNASYRRGWIQGRMSWARPASAAVSEQKPRLMSENDAWAVLIAFLEVP